MAVAGPAGRRHRPGRMERFPKVGALGGLPVALTFVAGVLREGAGQHLIEQTKDLALTFQLFHETDPTLSPSPYSSRVIPVRDFPAGHLRNGARSPRASRRLGLRPNPQVPR